MDARSCNQQCGHPVVNQGGDNAQFKGSGTVNGALDSNGNAYKFMLWAGDGSPDTFRIQIWWEDSAGLNKFGRKQEADSYLPASSVFRNRCDSC